MVASPARSGSVMELVLEDMPGGNTTDVLARLLDSQRELFHAQIDHLRRIILDQCKLTGVNPLSQEMAAGALSIKIGKRPRDLLNPKAIKYMQSIFSVKDTINKKETREISAICGATITQVREFFSCQRARVRKFVRLSREMAVKLDDEKHISNKCLFISSSVDTVSQPVPISSQHVPLDSVGKSDAKECTELQVTTPNIATALVEKQVPIDAIPLAVEHASCSPFDESTGIKSDDKVFLENIFNLMRKEETFSGQVKLMEWVLQINDSSILYWFVTEGGTAILATWLSQAALEEQTSMILVIFKVLCHLPLHKALPAQISVILQSVNKLRFYRTSHISNKARFLLSRWSKLFTRSQNFRRSSAMNCHDAQKERFRKQRINEILSDESWQSKVDIPGDMLAVRLFSSENSRELEHKPILKILPASYDNSSRKDKGAVSSTKTKERRKVLMMEQPDCTSTPRNVTVVREVPSNLSRPISADDIQKAKMRAIIMQDKYGKDATLNNKCLEKINDSKILHDSQKSRMSPISNSFDIGDDDKKHALSITESSQGRVETSERSCKSKEIPKRACKSSEILVQTLKCHQIHWQSPPEVKIFWEWSMGTGQYSKEVDVQTQRNQRENETFYLNANDIPSDPKDPWDIEMDFDDSLTPQVPIEQLAEADAGDGPGYEGCSELSQCHPSENIDKAQVLLPAATTTVPPVSNRSLEPDLELLAVLLRNPELVFALTNGQVSGINDAQTVALLDMLKNSGVPNSKEKTELSSLPSPTPSVERITTEWRHETSIPDNHPISQVLNPTVDVAPTVSPMQTTLHTPDMLRGNIQSLPTPPNLSLPHGPKATLSTGNATANLNPSSMQSADINLINGKSPSINYHNSADVWSPPSNAHDAVISNKQFNFGSTSGISFGHQSEAVNFDQVYNHSSPYFSNISSVQPLRQVSMSHHSHTTETQDSFRSLPPSKLRTDSDMRSKQALESWSSHQNGSLEASACGYQVQTNDRYTASLVRPKHLPPLYPESTSAMEIGDRGDFGNSNADRSSTDVTLVRSHPKLGTRSSQNEMLNQTWWNSSVHQNNHKYGRRQNWDGDCRR